MSNWISVSCYKILKQLTDKNGSGTYSRDDKKIKNSCRLWKKDSENQVAMKYFTLIFLNHKFTVDITERYVVVNKIY